MTTPETPPPTTCSITDCTKVKFCRGLCSMHYSRLIRHGSADVTLRQSPQVDVSQKRCPRCCQVKPIGDFGRRPNGNPEGYCRACKVAYEETYAATPTGREARRSARAKWNDGNHEYFLRYRYGITLAEYERLLAEQDGRCAICRSLSPGGAAKVWCVDHCHTSNNVRGLLCGACNRGLGQFKDDPERLLAAVAYLKNA